MAQEPEKIEALDVPQEEIEKFEQAPEEIPVVEDNTEANEDEVKEGEK